MPESLFAPRRFRRSYLVYCALAALSLEGSVVGIASIWRQNKTFEVVPPETIIEEPPPDNVQVLILPEQDPEPTPEQPTPPPDETPPPEDTPPPDMEPEMTLDTPPPTPTPGPPKKSTFVMPKVIPPGALRGPHPQNGVVGGVPSAARTSGPLPVKASTPPHTPKPPYPPQARLAKLTGSGMCHVTFDASGHCASATMTQSCGSSILDGNTVGFAKLNWTGSPNSATNVPITYRPF